MIVRELLICHDNWAYACSDHLVWCLLWIKERISDYSFLISHGWTMKCPVVILNYISCTHPWFSSKSRIIQYAGINIINPWSSMSLLKVMMQRNIYYTFFFMMLLSLRTPYDCFWQNGNTVKLIECFKIKINLWSVDIYCLYFSR